MAKYGGFFDPKMWQDGFNNVGGFFNSVGNAMSNGWNDFLDGLTGQGRARELASQENEKTRAYELYLANTAHQREMEDLKAAGLNPALTATGGAGAPAPSAEMSFSASDAMAGNKMMSLAMTALAVALLKNGKSVNIIKK